MLVYQVWINEKEENDWWEEQLEGDKDENN